MRGKDARQVGTQHEYVGHEIFAPHGLHKIVLLLLNMANTKHCDSRHGSQAYPIITLFCKGSDALLSLRMLETGHPWYNDLSNVHFNEGVFWCSRDSWVPGNTYKMFMYGSISTCWDIHKIVLLLFQLLYPHEVWLVLEHYASFYFTRNDNLYAIVYNL